jgi:RHS repeat-associated protein
MMALALAGMMVGPITPALASRAGQVVREAFCASRGFLTAKTGLAEAALLPLQDTAPQRAARVTSIQLCPHHLKLYVGETFTLGPVGFDNEKQIVQSVDLSWQSSAPAIASILSTGEVTAISSGTTTLTVTIGSSTATATVQVLDGVRPVQTDADWDAEHVDDCGNMSGAAPPERQRTDQIALPKLLQENLVRPVADRVKDSTATQLQTPALSASDGRIRLLPDAARPATFDLDYSGPQARGAAQYEARPTIASTVARKPAGEPAMLTPNLPEPIDGGDFGDSFSQTATTWYNVVGNPRYMPQEEVGGGGIQTKRKLGSADYSFTAPVLSLGGRGVGVNLALTYNSRLWNKESDGALQFNYNRGWPAAGWTFGYGRIIENYDNTGTGDKSGFGLANSPGNYLLIQPDGTRIHLGQQYDSSIQRWYHKSLDGSYLRLSPQKNLYYPDGTKISYIRWENRLSPNTIQTRNGDQISIFYRPRTSTFRFRWAIDHMVDTLGRTVTFHYYGDSGYPSGTGKPQSALASVSAPDQLTGQDRVLMYLEYQDVALSYNFATPPPADSVPTTLTVVRKIYYPATGRGYLFTDFSSYGMARKISMRKDMNTSSNPDGTEVAYTFYDYPQNTTASGQLNDAPKYTHRQEWWSGKTDTQGNSVSTPTIYTYQRDSGALADTVSIPDGTNTGYLLKLITSGSPQGFVSSVEMRDSLDHILRKTETFYSTYGNDGIPLPFQVFVTNEANEKTKTEYDYYPTYGRIYRIDEYGFTNSIQRRMEFEYIDDQSFIDHDLLQLVKWQRLYSGGNLNQPVAKTRFFYDDYSVKGGMETYTGLSIPWTHNSNFDLNYSPRGNLTTVRAYSSINPDASTDRSTKYDLFGNALVADVSCCNVKKAGFSYNTTWYSQPDYTRDGDEQSPPYLDTSFQYDFFTGLLKTVTPPNGQSASYTYDSAWRLDTAMDNGTGAKTITRFDKDADQNDQLSYFEQAIYDDNGTMKTITKRDWFDGGGHILKRGAGAGAAPTSYDMVKVICDHLGRSAKQSNPFSGDSSGNGTGLCTTDGQPDFCWTTMVYDALSRVKQVTLPDSQTITTDFTLGATVTVTDQVGRQKRSQVDGLERLIAVTEPNPQTGLLDTTNYQTTYSYNVQDLLTQVNQGGQTRSYKYDALGRLLFEKTPEQTPTIAEGGVLNQWTAAYTYTDFGAVNTRTDARGVVTTYGYGALNRLETIAYNTSQAGNVETTLPVALTYYSTGSGKGQVATIDNGTVLEEFAYDTVGRLANLQRTFTGNPNHYQTLYEYNAASQMSFVTYPSGKRLRINHDARGRMNGLDKMNGTVAQTSYLSQMSYSIAGQVTSMTLGSGVVDTFGYDVQRLQLTSHTATMSGTTLLSLQYSYQAAAGQSGAETQAGNSGQLISISGTINNQSRSQAFTYDDLGRLATATGWSSWQRRFVYDRWGNRTGVWDATSGGTQIQNITLQQTGGVPSNRLTSVSNSGATVTYTYDSNGNVTGVGQHTYSYDAENRLVTVDNGSSGTYSYDTANWRVKKVAAGHTTYCIWESGQVIAEYSDAPATGSGGLKYYEAGRLSTRLATSSTGSVLGTQDHMPFGEEAGAAGEAEKHRFTNYERDEESGTDYALNRQFSNGIGRFMQTDKVKGNISNPQSLNRYSYSLNDPINLSDPLGLTTCLVDWMQITCDTAFSLLRAGAGIVYNGNYIENIGGNLAPVRVGADGSLNFTIRTSMNSARAGTMTTGEDGEQMIFIGVLEKTINVKVPYEAIPVGLRYTLFGVAPRGIETDWGTQLIIGTAIGAAIKGIARLGASAAAEETILPKLGNKLKYLFGESAGKSAGRSAIMGRQLNSIGIFNDAAGRQLLVDHLTEVVNNSANIVAVQADGIIVRESLLIGPNGLVKLQTFWQGNSLNTAFIFGRGY